MNIGIESVKIFWCLPLYFAFTGRALPPSKTEVVTLQDLKCKKTAWINDVCKLKCYEFSVKCIAFIHIYVPVQIQPTGASDLSG